MFLLDGASFLTNTERSESVLAGNRSAKTWGQTSLQKEQPHLLNDPSLSASATTAARKVPNPPTSLQTRTTKQQRNKYPTRDRPTHDTHRQEHGRVINTQARAHLLRPDAGQQLVFPQQEIPLEPPLRRVRRRDRELAPAEVNLVVLAKVHPRRSAVGIDGARDAVEGGVATHGAEDPAHLGAGLEARGAAQDPLLDAVDGHAVEGQERQAHLNIQYQSV